MAGALVELFPPNPPRIQQPAGGGLFTRILIERSATSGGIYAQIANVAIDTGEEFTYYADTGGDDTFWYRYRYADTGLVNFSGYSAEIQAGDSIVRQDVRSEIPDIDITAAMWDRWGRYVMTDLYMLGIWYEDEGQIVITQNGSVPTQRYAVPGHIRDVYRIELRDTNGDVLDSLTDPEEVAFKATSRQIRIFDPEPATSQYRYWVVGKAQYRTLGELTDDYFVLVLHMLLVRYAQYRKRQRLNWKKFITFDPTTDILPKDIDMFIAEEKGEVAVRAAALAEAEPAIAIPN